MSRMDNRKKKSKKDKKYKIEEVDNKKTKKTKEGKEKKDKSNKKDKKKKKGIGKWIKRILLTFIILGIILAIVAAGIIVGIFTSDKYKVSEEDFEIKSITSKIVSSKDGSLITEVASDENRRVITLEEMGEYIPKAFVAIEDERFYSHSGIDIKRTAGAVVKFIAGSGSSSYGGSTITQQLIKNSFNDKDDEGAAGVERKIREMARAYNLEKIWSKDQILERYLNYIYMGGFSKNIMGVEMGAEYYFSKTAKELSLPEAAFLAGINNTPNSYDPFDEDEDNSELIKTRTIDVLWKMKEVGYITSEEEYNNAIQEVENGLKFAKGEIASETKYSYHTDALIDEVIKDLMVANDWTEELAKAKLKGNGYIIYSTEDPTIQNLMEEEFKLDKYLINGREKKKDGTLKNPGHTQAAMVIIDHTTGQVVGCMGGLGADADTTGYNRAIQGGKQPGSSIKPIGVIAPALEKKIITAGTVYDDAKTSFGSYTPHNSSYSFSGLINIRQALAESSNIVHVKIMKELGPSNSIAFLKTLGIDVPSTQEDLALALGTPTVTPLQMAVAYAAVANDGVYIEPTFYTKIEDSEGNLILEPTQDTRRIMSAENAYILQNLLTAPARSGTAYVCYMSYMDVGAKTGSTNGYKDRWLCGFTPYYTAATWYGFDESEKPNTSKNNAANIWAAIMKPIHKNLETKRFDRPSGVIYAKVCLDTGLSATETCTRTTSELFVRGTVPKACSGHEKIKICKETQKLATEKCTDVEEKSLLVKPPKEDTKLWKTDPEKKYDVPTETCDVHKLEKVKMPKVIGKTVEAAKAELEKIGLKVAIEYSEDKEKANGIVLKQSVEAEKEVQETTTITLTVNKKAEQKPENKPEQKPEDKPENTQKPENTEGTGNTEVDNSQAGNSEVTE